MDIDSRLVADPPGDNTTLVGLRLMVASLSPVCELSKERVTMPLKLLRLDNVMVEDADDPAVNVIEYTLAAMLKSGDALTVNETVTV